MRDPAGVVRRRFPSARGVTRLDAGWDYVVFDVDDEWIVRVPRRPEVEERLSRELRLLPELAPALPVAVPRLELVAGDPPAVAYPKIRGEPLRTPGARAAAELERFLRALHSFPAASARALGVVDDPRDARAAEFRGRVLPLFGSDERGRAARVLDEFETLEYEPSLVHGDLGSEHVLCAADGSVTGVIDWSDARIGDPALDYAWPLQGIGLPLQVDPGLRRHALVWHRLAPWHEVLYGLGRDSAFVERGLRGAAERL